MAIRFWIVFAVFALVACVASAATIIRPGHAVTDSSFFRVLKLPICVASLVSTAPLAGAFRLHGVSSDADGDTLRANLDRELNRTCKTFRTYSAAAPKA